MIQLTSLIYYPIKACRGTVLDAARVERMGLENDRRMMVVTPDGKFLTQREYPKLALVRPTLEADNLTLNAPNMDLLCMTLEKSGDAIPVDIWESRGVQAIDQGKRAADWFSEWLGAEVRLVHIADGYQRSITKFAVTENDHTGFADGYPILIISEESLADLNSRLERQIPMDRFRPNLVVKGCGPFDEDGWKRISIGEVELAVVKPCDRCVVTTIDKETLEKSKEPLKTLSTYRNQAQGAMFGQNVIPLNEGRLKLGMNVKILT